MKIDWFKLILKHKKTAVFSFGVYSFLYPAKSNDLFKKFVHKVKLANSDIVFDRERKQHPFFYTRFAQQFHPFNWYIEGFDFTIFGFFKGRRLIKIMEAPYKAAFRKEINSETLSYTNNISNRHERR